VVDQKMWLREWDKLLKVDFVIIGAGVAGLATAQALLQRGASVTLLERGEVGMESSWAGGGILAPLCPWDYAEEVTRLTGLGGAMFPHWTAGLLAATGVDPEYTVSGMLVLGLSDHSVASNWCIANGQTLLEQAKDTSLGGIPLLLPEVAQVRNPRLVQALRQHVLLLGGRIVENCELKEIATLAGKVSSLITSGGIFSADRYIVCAGAWSKQVLGAYALDLDIKPIRGQMLLFKFGSPPVRHILLQDGMYLIPRRDGHLLVGSTLEDVGFDKSTTADAHASLLQRAMRILPALRGAALVRHWSGLRPASPHNIPTIGRHPQLDNLYINSGHFRYGVTMAPASAQILVNELSGIEQPFDTGPYKSGWGVRKLVV
jgi:glycine oxidase